MFQTRPRGEHVSDKAFGRTCFKRGLWVDMFQTGTSGGHVSDKDLRRTCFRHGLGADMVEGIISEVGDTGFWKQNGASEHLEKMLAACLKNLFATFEGTPGGCRMPQGRGAGNPLADLLFSIAFCEVVQMLRRKFREAGLNPSLTIEGARAFLGIGPDGTAADVVEIKDSSYSDDLAAVRWCQPAHGYQVLKKAGEIAWFVYE